MFIKAKIENKTMDDKKPLISITPPSIINLFRNEPAVIPDKGPIPTNIPKQPYGRAEHPPMPPTWLKYKGVFDFEGLYRLMVRWLKERKFEFYETLHKAKPPELELVWRAERRKTGYIMEVIDIYFHLWDAFDVEVIQDGKKKILTKARMSVSLTPRIITAYGDIFGSKRWNTEIERRMMSLFNKYIIKQDLDQMYDDVLYYETYKLHTAMKKFLGMSTEGSAFQED